jgi:FKBP-type peptidyl-prolyl cis-trans isomerase FkpA
MRFLQHQKVISMKSGLVSIALIMGGFIISPMLQAQDSSVSTATGAAQAPSMPTTLFAPQNVSSLIKTDTQVGTGDEARYGSNVEVHYTGWLYNPRVENLHGAKFDSSLDAGKPFVFMLGARQVVKGWDLGVMGMKVGGKRTLVIPSYLGYSTNGSGSIPPNTHLVFDIELLSVK